MITLPSTWAFAETLHDVKNVGGGLFQVRVGYANQMGQSLDKCYDVTSTTFTSIENFKAFIQTELDALNNANVILYEVQSMIGGPIVTGGS